MEWLEVLFGSLIPLAFLGLIVWAIARVIGSRREEPDGTDQALSVRRLFVYGLMFTTLVLIAIGVGLVLRESSRMVWGNADDESSALAFGLALVIVAAPAYGFLLRYACRRLAELTGERRSLAWAAYLNLSLALSLIVTVAASQQMLEGVTGVDDFEAESVVPVVVWGVVWAMHWFWLKAAYGLPGDLHLAVGSLTGLVTMSIGLGGLAFMAGDEIYTGAVESIPTGHSEPELRSWAIATCIGALVWFGHWLRRYLSAERTSLWHVYVVLLGALGGLVAAVGAAATIGYWTLVWFLGDSDETSSSMHFEYVLAVGAAVLIVGVAVWQYHRYVLQRLHGVERSEPLRVYDYLMVGAGLVGTIVAVTLALVALLEAITPEPVRTETSIANRLILAVTLVAIGAPLWWVFWSRIRRHALANVAAELGSMVRRVHLIVVFGVGGIIVLISLINVLFVGFEDLLDGTFGGHTVRSFRVGVSLVVTVTGVAWYHLGVFRSDSDILSAIEPVAPVSARKHVVLIAPGGTTLAQELISATGADLQSWHRGDDIAMPEIDLKELVAQIKASEAKSVVVIVSPEGPTLIPLES